MNVQEQIEKYITSQPEPKRSEMQALHRITLEVLPECKLWFFDGKKSANKTGISVYILMWTGMKSLWRYCHKYMLRF